MSKGSALALANFLSTLGQAVPGIAYRYQEDESALEKKNADEQLRSQAADILKNVPQFGADMSPQDATAVLAQTSPEDKAQAVNYLAQNRQGLDALRLKFPDSYPDAPGTDNVLQQLASSPPKQAPDVIESIRPVIRDMESGGNYAQLHPMTKSGKQALGAYGILPDIWFKAFPQFGLDASKPEDRQKFLQSPALQDAMFTEIAKKGLADTGGDLRKFRAWWYGGPEGVDSLASGKGSSPQTAFVGGRAVAMPSVADDADIFMRRLQDAGVDPQVAMASSPGRLPFDASYLLSRIQGGPPQMKVLPRKVTRGDQEGYLLSQIKSPEMMALLSGHLKAFGDMAREERDQARQDHQDYRQEVTDYDQNVRALTNLNFDTWKALEEKAKAGHQLRNEELAAARARRDELRNEITAVRTFAARMVKEKDDEKEKYQSLYPEFFTTTWEQPSSLETLFGGKGSNVVKYDPSLVTKRMQDLESEYESIDNFLANRSGTQNVVEAPTPTPNISKYLIPRKK